jgi:hypothetical protein
VEFKQNNFNSEEIGGYLSALSNPAALYGKTHEYLIWSIANQTHEIVGTTFCSTMERRCSIPEIPRHLAVLPQYQDEENNAL